MTAILAQTFLSSKIYMNKHLDCNKEKLFMDIYQSSILAKLNKSVKEYEKNIAAIQWLSA